MRVLPELTGEEWVGITRDNYEQWVGTPFKRIVWCAGFSSKTRSEIQPSQSYKDNAANVEKAIKDFPCEKFIYISSEAVYPPALAGAKRVEDYKHTTVDWKSLSKYGQFKLEGENRVIRRCKNYLILRCSSLVGPGLKKNVVYDLTHGGPIYLSMDSKLQFVHTDVLGYLMCRLSNETGIINIAPSDTITVENIARQLQINTHGMWVAEPEYTWAAISNRKLMSLLDIEEQYMLLHNAEALTFYDKPYRFTEGIKIYLRKLRNSLGKS
jgi:nucleoside-diphosphate-sugar epimerase